MIFLKTSTASIFYFGAMKEVDVEIRRAQGLEDYQAVVELEKEVWGYTEMEDLAAVPILMIANRFGGVVLVAQESSGRIDSGRRRISRPGHRASLEDAAAGRGSGCGYR
ncbi:MAG: hypothetical protein AUG12_03500 [Acidobacteria bacterium 13_1_20CM_2_57_8]|nr:MAG: hypothetical protein AUG12_03500 [Acidobacteria bacterium 13_1_20CM_2_57_8]